MTPHSRTPAARHPSTSVPATPPPRPALWRDPWLWASLIAVLLVLVRSLGAPLGEPVADDFDHLHHALFIHGGSWFGSGGSGSFWRPLAYQGYYGLLHDMIVMHPVWISALHLALLGVVVVLLFDIARAVVPGPAAATIASFPLLLEAARALIVVPVHIVDLGLLTASVLAWWFASSGRLAPALGALLGALLFKETAVATALVLPWLARLRPGDSRRQWFIGSAVLTLAWALTYLTVRRHLAMTLPHGLEAQLQPALFLDPARYAWAVLGSLRAVMSLPIKPEPREGFVLAGTLLVLGIALIRLAGDDAARRRWRAQRAPVLTGLAWFVLATGTLLSVYPVWSPERVVYASLGLGAALGMTLAAAHPALPVALLTLRLATFMLAPAALPRVTRSVPDRGAFVDFERLARLQRLMLEARTALRHEFPVLPHGANVAMIHPPFQADYASGDRALQVWYRDTTLRWVHWDQMEKSGARGLAGAMEFQEGTTPQFRRIEPEALRLLFVAGQLEHEQHWLAALDTLRRADTLQVDREARHFVGRLLGLKAWCLGADGKVADAEIVARQCLAVDLEDADGHLTMAAILNGRQQWSESLAHLDTLLTYYPEYQAGEMMRTAVVKRMREQGVVPSPRAAAPLPLR